MATTGRTQVSPGQTIASTWGNTVADQSINTFDSAADRAAQWPSPKDGAVSYLADSGALFLRQGGVWRGFTPGQSWGAYRNTDGAGSASTWVFVTGVSNIVAPAGRYLCTASLSLVATSATGNASSQLTFPAGSTSVGSITTVPHQMLFSSFPYASVVLSAVTTLPTAQASASWSAQTNASVGFTAKTGTHITLVYLGP